MASEAAEKSRTRRAAKSRDGQASLFALSRGTTLDRKGLQMRRGFRRFLGFSLAFAAACGPAAAAEYCVVCNGPEAHYRCMTGDGQQGAGTDQGVWLQCISQLAKLGGHESCSIDRTSVAPCQGEVRNVDSNSVQESVAPRPLAPSAAPLPQVPSGAPPAQGNAKPAKPPGPPAAIAAVPTGEPMAQPPADKDGGAGPVDDTSPAKERDAAEDKGVLAQSKDGLDKAGSAIGDATKKSWKCMTSWFKDC